MRQHTSRADTVTPANAQTRPLSLCSEREAVGVPALPRGSLPPPACVT